MPDFVRKRKRGRHKEKTRIKCALEKTMEKKTHKKRKRPIVDDGLGLDDVKFSFGVGDGNVWGEEDGEMD